MKKTSKVATNEETARGRTLRRGELRDRPRIEEIREERSRSREEIRETQERSRSREERRETQERSRNREERRRTQERSRNREERRGTQERSRNREERRGTQSWYPERSRFTLNLRSESRPIRSRMSPIRSQSRRMSPVRSSQHYKCILRLTFVYLF